MPDKKEFEVEDGKLKITDTKEEVKVMTFDYDYLIAQRQRIQEQKDKDNAQRDLELAEIDAYIVKAKEFLLDVPAAEVIEP